MIFDSIILRNFGIFRGVQEIPLAPTDVRKPIILFGGMNGGGKTTFLDAVQLALYGAKARCSGRGKLQYRDYLKEMIHRGVDHAEGASIDLRFRRAVDGEMHYFRISRAWRDQGDGIRESVEVTRDAALDPFLSENWDEYIENYIPSGIAHLFFFDAEQIKELAEGEHAAQILGTAINTLLGLDLVDRLDADLVALVRRKRSEVQSNEQAEKIRRAQEEVARAQTILDDAMQAQGSLGNEAGRLAKERNECEQRFRQEGGELYLNKAALDARCSKIKEERTAAATALRQLLAGPAPVLLALSLLDETAAQAQREAQTRLANSLIAALEERDTAVLTQLKRDKLPGRHLEAVQLLFRRDREARSSRTGEPSYLDGGDHLPAELRHLRDSVLPDLRVTMKRRHDELQTLDEQLARAESELARIPTDDAIADLHARVTSLRDKQQTKQAELAIHDEKVRILVKQLDEAKRRYEKELGYGVDEQLEAEHGSRILKHSARVRETLTRFRAAVVQKHAQRLELLVLEAFTHLLRKKSLVKGLTINPESFQLELVGGDGATLPFERLSAGERQLLATSILWGLAKASGRPLPTIIDTPLGRLDSSHRRHLLERYFPVASHQVILLSTDEEVDEPSWNRLKPHLGRSYTLKFDEETRSTTVAPGYFWNHESHR
jgi:DNA sulfur modification protein DndD